MSLSTGRIQIARQIVRGALHHRLNGEAAKTAYYLFLSLFPWYSVTPNEQRLEHP